MNGFVDDIEDLTEANSDFRRVLYTAKHLQLVLMSLRPGEDIGEETHTDRDQFFRIEEGKGEVFIDGTRRNVKSGHAILVPAGARHNLRNTGDEPLRLYTLYGPSNHRDGVVQVTKKDAEKSKEHFDGKTTEARVGREKFAPDSARCQGNSVAARVLAGLWERARHRSRPGRCEVDEVGRCHSLRALPARAKQ